MYEIEKDPANTIGRRIRTRAAARELRRRPTDTEQQVWMSLRLRQIDGLMFRRQHPIGPYIVDFCCYSARLVVEIDGAIHEHQVEYDAERDQYLHDLGYTVLRFTNDRVIHDLGGVIHDIRTACLAPPPSRTGEGVGG